ncbi:MAG: molybdopterin-dependent oxidoreductase [Desulfobacteraceae bacterium]|nr:molybdopterin-dependent oxidoreductase [Desulfobacteraceae bacterium]
MAFRKLQETVRPFESVRKTTCGNCPAGCGLKVFLKDGKPTDIFGDEEHPLNKGSICPKGLLTCFYHDHPERLTTPAIRQSLSEPFRDAGWDEAIDFTAKKLKHLIDRNGADSIVIYGRQSDPFDYTAAGDRLAQCLKVPYGPSRFHPAPVDANGLTSRMFGVPIANLQTNSPRDWCNSRCILLYCCDLAASDPITLGPILDARDRGATLLCIDQHDSVTSSKATMALRVKPGTQSVLLGGILHLLLRRNSVDTDFVAEWTEGFEALGSEVEKFTPEMVCRTCGVDPLRLNRFVELLGAAKPVQVIAGGGISRRFLTGAEFFGCAAVACLSGSIGIPGGGVNFLGVSPFSGDRAGEGDGRGGVHLERLLAEGKTIGSLFWHGNPCIGLTGGKETRAALSRIPLIVHLSSCKNGTYQLSHVFLPVSHWLEYDGIYTRSNGRAVQAHGKVADPPGDCRSRLDFWVDLAGALGLPAFDSLAKTSRAERDSAFCDAMLRQNPLTSAIGFDRLDPNRNAPGGILWPCAESSLLEFESTRFVRGTVRGQNILFQRNRSLDSSGKRFPTASGKIEFPPFSPAERARSSEPAHPLMLITGMAVDSLDQFGDFVFGKNGEEGRFVKINPRLAEAIGVKNGDSVTVENARGQVRAPARLTDDVDVSVVWVPEGAYPDQDLQCAGPMSLFDIPAHGRAPDSFALVTAYKTGSDRNLSRERIVRFLAGGH